MKGWVIVSFITFAYLVLVLYIGVKARSKSKESTLDDYIADGRSIGLFVLFFIMGAEIFSAFAFLGGPGWTYSKGAPGLYIIGYLGLGLLPMWVFGPKTARIGKKYGYLTQAELLSARFQSSGLSGLMAIISVAAFIPYLTIQIKGAGFLVDASTGGNIPFWLGSLIAFVVVAVYVFTSGLRGIGWTNVIQGIIMVIVAWIIGLAIPYKFYGGVSNMFREIAQKAPDYLTLPGHHHAMSFAAFSTALIVSVIGLSMWPHIFSKSYGADSEKTLKKTIILYPLYGYILVPIFFVGFAGILVFAGHPLKQSDTILVALIAKAHFSPWLIGILLSGALAAAMSTGANLAHTAATVIVQDFYVKLFRPNVSEKNLVNLIRVFVLIISLLSYLLALYSPASLVSLLLIAYGGVVQFFPLIVAAFFWRRTTKAGVFAGLISGTLVTIYYSFFAHPPLDIHAGICGLIVNTILMIFVSLLTNKPNIEHVEQFLADSRVPLSKVQPVKEISDYRNSPASK